jgi:hypothetical protein
MADDATFPIAGDAEDPVRDSGEVRRDRHGRCRPAPVDQIGDASAREAEGDSPGETSVPHDGS